MAALSNYLEEAFLNHVLRTATFAKPSVIAVALATATPTDTNTGSTFTEVTNASAYARVSLSAPANATWKDPSTATQGTTNNLADITFPTASGGNWGTVTAVVILDNTTYGAGNILFYGALTSSKTVNDGDTFKFATGDLTITID